MKSTEEKNFTSDSAKKIKELLQGIKNAALIYKISYEEAEEILKEALAIGFKQEFKYGCKMDIHIDKDNNDIKIIPQFEVIDQADLDKDEDPETGEGPIEYHKGLLTVEEAKVYKKDAKPGDLIVKPEMQYVEFWNWSRKTISILQQVLIQKFKSLSRQKIKDNYNELVGKIVLGNVEGKNETGYFVKLEDNNIGFLPNFFCSPLDKISSASKTLKTKFLLQSVSDIKNTSQTPILLSRSSAKFVEELFKEIVPELSDGTIEILCSTRIAGIRSKLGVKSNSHDISPIGTMIGPGLERLNEVKSEIFGEKIEIVEISNDLREFISKACYPASIIKVSTIKENVLNKKTEITENKDVSYIIVDDTQIGQALGPKGINIHFINNYLSSEAKLFRIIKLSEASDKGLLNNNDDSTENLNIQTTQKDNSSDSLEPKEQYSQENTKNKTETNSVDSKSLDEINVKKIKVDLTTQKEIKLSLEEELASENKKDTVKNKQHSSKSKYSKKPKPEEKNYLPENMDINFTEDDIVEQSDDSDYDFTEDDIYYDEYE